MLLSIIGKIENVEETGGFEFLKTIEQDDSCGEEIWFVLITAKLVFPIYPQLVDPKSRNNG